MIDLQVDKSEAMEYLDEAELLLRILQRDPRPDTRQRAETLQIEAELSALWQCWSNNEHGPYSGTLEAYEAQQEIGQDALRLMQRLTRIQQELEGRV